MICIEVDCSVEVISCPDKVTFLRISSTTETPRQYVFWVARDRTLELDYSAISISLGRVNQAAIQKCTHRILVESDRLIKISQSSVQTPFLQIGHPAGYKIRARWIKSDNLAKVGKGVVKTARYSVSKRA